MGLNARQRKVEAFPFMGRSEPVLASDQEVTTTNPL
jgi:hypothetical protein